MVPSVRSASLRVLACVGLAALALSWGLGHAHADSTQGVASLASTDQTLFLTAINNSAVASEGADFKTILNADGLFVSVTSGSVSFTIPGAQMVTVDSGDVAVFTGDATRGTYIDVLNGSVDISNGPDDEDAMVVNTSIGIAFAPANPDADLAAIEQAISSNDMQTLN